MRWRCLMALVVVAVVAGLLVPQVGASPPSDKARGPGLSGLPAAVRGRVSALLAGEDTVNPFHQQGPKLTPNNEDGEAGFGLSVALSSDGSTLLVGSDGAAWVFVRSASTWTQQAKLTASNEAAGCDVADGGEFGYSVALSADGSTALIGSPQCETDTTSGAATVFVRSGSTWREQGPTLLPNDEDAAFSSGEFGSSVALSEDGNTALIGAPFDSNGTYWGSAWVFVRSGGTWTQQGSRLAPASEGDDKFGQSVALSGDGNTALVGGQGYNGSDGAAWVFTRNGSTWSQQGSALTGSGVSSFANQGYSVALSSDGNTALIGGPFDHDAVGAAWVFVRSGTSWTQQGEKLTASGESGKAQFGWSVALSGDGNTALIGGRDNAKGVGAAWVFVRSGKSWTQQGSELTGTDEDNTPYGALFGRAAALSSDGSTALIGGPGDHDDEGAAWPFLRCTTSDGGTQVESYVAAASGAGECPVKVWVNPVENPVKSGFHPDHEGAKASPAFLTNQPDPVPGGEPIADKCGSGCENVAITVTAPEATSADDPQYPGISDVKVIATIGGAYPADAEWPYPRIMSVKYSGTPGPVLCLIEPDTGNQTHSSCSDTVTGTTDSHGKIYLRVWFPGVVQEAKFLLSAKAEKCNQGTCTQVGDGKSNLTMMPNIVFKQRAWLSDTDADALVKFYRNKLISDDFSWLQYLPAGKFGGLIKFLKDHYGDYQKLTAGGDLLAVSILMGSFGLKPDGLLANDVKDLVPTGTGLYGDSFYAGLVSVAKDYGAYLDTVPSNASGHGNRQRMLLAIYEVSMCVHTSLCDNPTLGTDPGPYLVFSLQSAKDDAEITDKSHSVKVFGPSRAVTYHAVDWFASQF